MNQIKELLISEKPSVSQAGRTVMRCSVCERYGRDELKHADTCPVPQILALSEAQARVVEVAKCVRMWGLDAVTAGTLVEALDALSALTPPNPRPAGKDAPDRAGEGGGIGFMSHPIKVIDHEPHPIDSFKHNWHLFEVTVLMSDGTEQTGSMQGSGDSGELWAVETWEADPK